ncbi:MAG: gamma-glutamylcyclotransferase [Gemmataceae bacterium]|nr:gamma-glutamylcyclotransferase [Gemmataceae bacterium]MDW8266046.1 gamma-glutamylcyclotransferase family protein [Gemmataceae bacterium]
MPTRLFVYGTLRRGHKAHHLLNGQKFLGEARTQPLYRLLDRGPYPCLVLDPPRGCAVHGEIWQVSDDLLPVLDRYEGPEFHREPVALEGDPSPTQAYFFHGDTAGYPDCGDRWC